MIDASAHGKAHDMLEVLRAKDALLARLEEAKGRLSKGAYYGYFGQILDVESTVELRGIWVEMSRAIGGK